MRGAEAVKEVDKRHAGFESRGLCDQSGVHDFLNIIGSQQRPAGLADRHDVLMVSEDGQSLRSDGARGNMNDAGREFTSDLVHVGDHEEQTLGRGERSGQAAALKSAVQRACGAALTLHFHHVGNGSPDVGLTIRGPLVTELAHGRRRRDGINRYNFIGFVRDVCGGFVAVNSHFDPIHKSVLQGLGREEMGRSSRRRKVRES